MPLGWVPEHTSLISPPAFWLKHISFQLDIVLELIEVRIARQKILLKGTAMIVEARRGRTNFTNIMHDLFCKLVTYYYNLQSIHES